MAHQSYLTARVETFVRDVASDTNGEVSWFTLCDANDARPSCLLGLTGPQHRIGDPSVFAALREMLT